MSRITLALAIAATFTLSASASEYGHYVSLWNSPSEMVECEYWGDGKHDLYVWIHPGPDGVYAFELALLCPEGYDRAPDNPQFAAVVTKGPIAHELHIGSHLGPSPGIAQVFNWCAYTVTWVYGLTVYVENDNLASGYYRFAPSEWGNFIVANCAGRFEEQPLSALNRFGYNAYCGDGFIGTHQSSWGAIKNLMK